MTKSIEKRLEDNGITKEDAKKVILQRGLLQFCEDQSCGYMAGKRYAESIGLQGGQLISERSIWTTQDTARELISAMFTKWKQIEAENERLRLEINEIRQIEEHRQALAKAQLFEMMEAVKA